jgi:uncharacterized protein YegP (UPF0339 family)
MRIIIETKTGWGRKQKHRCVIVAGNNEPLVWSEKYHNLSDVETMVTLLKAEVPTAKVEYITV